MQGRKEGRVTFLLAGPFYSGLDVETKYHMALFSSRKTKRTGTEFHRSGGDFGPVGKKEMRDSTLK